MRQVLLTFLLALCLIGPVFAATDATKPVTIFSARDPHGDDAGDGTIRYPSDAVFAPGLFDLLRFSVLADSSFVYFRFQFGLVTNPWSAPEGFYHQRIDLFIDTGSGIGKHEPLRPGPGPIRFPSDHPWDLWLRIAPWDGGRLFTATDPPDSSGRSDGIYVRVLEPHTIEVAVPQSIMPHPAKDWHYYVLVGSFDGLGIDGYRAVESEPSRWLLSGTQPDVRVIDILASAWGKRSQARQLRLTEDGVLMLRPFGSVSPWKRALVYGAGVVLLGALGLLIRRWPKRHHPH